MVNFKEDEQLSTLNHSCAHLMAQAIKHLYPQAKFWVGPVVAEGFYYDVDLGDDVIRDEDIPKIEKEMKKVAKSGKKIIRKEISKEEAMEMFKDDEYKLDLISNLEDGTITCYEQGDFTDLCRGPHVDNVKLCRNFKLLRHSGAYWKGDSNNKVLQRIYGVCFPTPEELEAHLQELEEAKERDHRKIGKDMELFMVDDLIGRGLPMFLPKGYIIWQELENYIKDKERKLGYQHVMTPCVGTVNLYKTSGHWDHYKEGMFVLGDEDKDKEVFALRPMTCPFQYQVFLNRQRSYRELPMRLTETSTLFRNEDSGEMHGLIRVRQFTISEGHYILRPDQLEEEFKGCLELAKYFLDTVGLLDDCTFRFSQWDPANPKNKYEGTAEQWEHAQAAMKTILDDLGVDYDIGIDEAAFYGPKLDIQYKNVYGKEDTLITIQIDQMLAEKFGMEYVDRDGVKKNPYIIHRTSIGCYERTLALLIEKYAGAFPMWLAPVQVKLLTIADRHCDYAYDIKRRLEENGIRAEVDDRNEKIGYKIREARLQKVPYMLIIGDNEAENGTLSVRERGENGDLGSMSADEFIERAVSEDKSRIIK